MYFAYGSNMDLPAMVERCPASRSLGPARLDHHRLVIMREGYASVVRDPSSHVYGLLWAISPRDIAALDRYEDVEGGLYRKEMLTVSAGSGPHRALVYVGENAGPGHPSRQYGEAVVAAAHAAALPFDYLEELRTCMTIDRAGETESG